MSVLQGTGTRAIRLMPRPNQMAELHPGDRAFCRNWSANSWTVVEILEVHGARVRVKRPDSDQVFSAHRSALQKVPPREFMVQFRKKPITIRGGMFLNKEEERRALELLAQGAPEPQFTEFCTEMLTLHHEWQPIVEDGERVGISLAEPLHSTV